MNCRHLMGIVVWLVAVSFGVAWTPLLAQTPAPTLPPAQACPPEAEWLQHLVRPGDQWATIAAQYGVSEADLRAANPTPLGLLRIGLPVRIPCAPKPPTPVYATPRATATVPPSASSASTAGICTPPAGWGVRYTVLRGDTLSRLAAACRTTSAAIRQANGCRSSDILYAGETLLLPCWPATLATATPAQIQPVASPRSPAIPDRPPQPGPLRVSLNPADAVVGASIGVTIQDAGAHEPLAVAVSCGGQTMTTFGVTASGNGAAAVSFSTAGFPAGRCRVDVARTVVSGGGSARLILAPAVAPSAQTLSASSTTDAAAAATTTTLPSATSAAPIDAPPDTTPTPSPPAETTTPGAPPAATSGAETTSDEQATSAAADAPTRTSLPATPTEVAPPVETQTTTATLTPPPTVPSLSPTAPASPTPAEPTVTKPAVANPTAPPPPPTASGTDVDAPDATQTAASP